MLTETLIVAVIGAFTTVASYLFGNLKHKRDHKLKLLDASTNAVNRQVDLLLTQVESLNNRVRELEDRLENNRLHYEAQIQQLQEENRHLRVEIAKLQSIKS